MTSDLVLVHEPEATKSGVGYHRFLGYADDFYQDPDAVRAKALRSAYLTPEGVTGPRSARAHLPIEARARFGGLLMDVGLALRGFKSTGPKLGNGSFFRTFGAGEHKEAPTVHFDLPARRVTGVVYLTPDLPPEFGTSLWRHRETGLTDYPGRKDALRLGMTLEELDYVLERDEERASAWEEIARVRYQYNRVVLYHSGMLHSATAHYGKTPEEVRIYQTFRLTTKRVARV